MTKKILALVCVMVLLASTAAMAVSAASYSTGSYTVSASSGVNVRSGAGTGYSKVGAASKGTTFTVSKISGDIHVTLRDWKGNWICEFDAKSGQKLKLGDNYSQYRVYIAKKQYSNSVSDRAADFINCGECVYWAIECTSNCYV